MLLAKNRKALRNHELIEKYLAGIVLKGYEVKAIREKKVDFEGAYVRLIEGVPYIVGLQIGHYSKQSQEVTPEESRQPRPLLLEKREIEKLKRDLDEKGKTAVPLALLLQHNLIKLEFAVVRGRKEFEKKQVAKEKQIKKDLEREAKAVGAR